MATQDTNNTEATIVYSHPYDLAVLDERMDFIRRQGGAESAEAMAAVKDVDARTQAMATAANVYIICLDMYVAAEMAWAHAEYEAMVAAIRSGAARFVNPGVSLDDAGNIIISAETIMAMSQEDDRPVVNQ